MIREYRQTAEGKERRRALRSILEIRNGLPIPAKTALRLAGWPAGTESAGPLGGLTDDWPDLVEDDAGMIFLEPVVGRLDLSHGDTRRHTCKNRRPPAWTL